MERINDFFISHNSDDKEHARALYNVLKAINPEWEIWLDCSDKRPLEVEREWCDAMHKAAGASKYLIFVTSSPDYLKDGGGWVYEEVSYFHSRKATRIKRNAADRTIAYFGIFLGGCDLENELFNDPDKGATYNILYNSPQHLMLAEGESVEMAAERIRDKVMHLMSEKSSALAAELLDKVNSFACEREKQDEMFSRTAICDRLIPPLAREGDSDTDFDGLCDILSHSHVAIFSNEGGCGKTTLLTKLFYHYLDKAGLGGSAGETMIPIYIEAKTLSAENFLILRYISHTLYGEYTAMTDRFTGDTVKKIGNEFSLQTAQPGYLLLIDGYNEIPEASLSAFDKELKDFMPGGRYSNVRLVISSRESGTVFREEAFCELRLEKLSNLTVSEYMKENNAWHGKIEETLFDILKIPMYLKLYVETAANNQIHSKSDLLMEFVKWQSGKDAETSTTDRQKAQFHIMLYHILPLLAHRMAMTNQLSRGSAVDESELEEIFETCSSLIKETPYRKYFGSEYREMLRLSEFNTWDSFDIMDVSLSYFTQTCKLLRKSTDGRFDFIHQVYREFFCALFISEDIKRSASVRGRCMSLEPSELKPDIKEFVAGLLSESMPHYDKDNDRWEYSCNDDSYLIALMDISRETGQKDNPVYISNVVELLKYARRNNLSGCDFSGLDLTGCDLRTCLMYRRDSYGEYASSFAGAKINRENLLCGNHFSAITAACLNDEYLASADALGVIKLWSRDRRVSIPLKTLTDVRCNIKKLIFSPDGKALYAATPHEILEIELPEGDFAQVKPRVLYETSKILRDIRLGKDNEILFSTVFNSFNYKSISEPQAPDLHKFRAISSCSAVNASGNQVAFGHIAGHKGLKIYNYSEEADEWIEQKVGYSLLLEQYIMEQEEALRSFGYYDVFPHDGDDAPLMSKGRSSYFIHLQLQFEDRTHYHEEMPEKIIRRILKLLRVNGIMLNPDQLKEIWRIATEYKEKLEVLREENPLLLFVSGRKIESVAYREDADILLLSCINVFEVNGKDSYDSVVLELNTRTLETRAITRFGGVCGLRAWYSGDGIIIGGEYRLSVYDLQGDKMKSISALSKKIYKVFQPEHSSSAFAAAYHFIYETDENGRCINCFNNSLGSYNVAYCMDENGERYLVRVSDLKKTAEEKPKVTALKLSNGSYRTVPNCLTVCKERSTEESGRVAQMYSEKLVFFDNGIRTDELEICYKLFVCGCDFSGVRGTLANPHDLQLLYKYGAKTDIVSHEYEGVQTDMGTAAVSDREFEPESIDAVTPYIYRPGMSVIKRNFYKQIKGKDKLVALKTWNRIYTGFCENRELEAADYSILEWVSKLSCVTSKMIYELMSAGIVEKPTRYEYLPEAVDARMADCLHHTFKLLIRYAFTDGETVEEPFIYTLTPFYGQALLLESAGEKPLKTDMEKTVLVRETMIRNAWFCTALNRSGGELVSHAFRTVFRTEDHADGVGRIDAYVKLNEQAFFVETFRKSLTDKKEENIANKVERLSLMATYFRHLMNGDNAERLSVAPVLVMICEDYEHCREINRIICDIAPQVRKLFTYDTLIESGASDNHFEFINGEPFAVRLEDLV